MEKIYGLLESQYQTKYILKNNGNCSHLESWSLILCVSSCNKVHRKLFQQYLYISKYFLPHPKSTCTGSTYEPCQGRYAQPMPTPCWRHPRASEKLKLDLISHLVNPNHCLCSLKKAAS